jgi:hypothetical protein
MPSIFAVTPFPSMNVEKLMDTLRRASSAPMDDATSLLRATTRRLARLESSSSSTSLTSSAYGLFSARVLRKGARKSSHINKTAKTARHAFQWCGTSSLPSNLINTVALVESATG